MKETCRLLLIILVFCTSMPVCHAFSLNGSGSVYVGSAKNMAKYYPQNTYSNRYSRQQKSYIFSPQQAKYYGYRVPQQQTSSNSYYNPYSRGY